MSKSSISAAKALIEPLHELAFECFKELGVMIPPAVVNRDKAHSHFHESAGEEQALSRDHGGRRRRGPC